MESPSKHIKVDFNQPVSKRPFRWRSPGDTKWKDSLVYKLQRFNDGPFMVLKSDPLTIVAIGPARETF